MRMIELRLSKYHFYWSLYSKEMNGICGESVSTLAFLLKPVNVALRVMGEFVRYGVTESSFFGVIIGVIELLANSICGNCFLIDYHVLFNFFISITYNITFFDV